MSQQTHYLAYDLVGELEEAACVLIEKGRTRQSVVTEVKVEGITRHKGDTTK